MPAKLRALLINFGLWTLLCTVAGISTYGDAAHNHDPRSLWMMTLGWWCGYVVIMVQSYLLYLVYHSHAHWLGTRRLIVRGYLLYMTLCWPLAMLGLAYRRCFKFDLTPNLANAWHYWFTMDKFEWFVVFTLLTLAFGVVVAGLLWQHLQQQTRELTAMRLSLERQRLAALRGQLEPHFIFNTLSAIGAMVRADDKPVALEGLSRFGDLLQYALASTERDWVSLTQELQFVLDYLELQHLRFGTRLQVNIEWAHVLDAEVECPPMLLQPLVENALRHDLECHGGSSDISVTFSREEEFLIVRVSNPAFAQEAATPGLGIGLRGIRARLLLAYGNLASLDIARNDGQFVAALRLPWQVMD